MGGRYWITGVQLALLAKELKDFELPQRIMDEQFIGNTFEKDNEIIRLLKELEDAK